MKKSINSFFFNPQSLNPLNNQAVWIFCILFAKASLYTSCVDTPWKRGVGSAVAHYHLKRHALKRVTVRAVFEEVKSVLFYTTIEEF